MKKMFLGIMFLLAVAVVFGQKSSKNDGIEFCGTYWYLQSINGKEIANNNDAQPFIRFDKGNGYGGSLGCNDFFGRYSLSRRVLKMKYAGATKKLCSNMETEELFLKALKVTTCTYSIDGDVLMLTGNGIELKFKAKSAQVKSDRGNAETMEQGESESNDKNDRETQREDRGDSLGE